MLAEDGVRIQCGPVSTGHKVSCGFVQFELSVLDLCLCADLIDRLSDTGLSVLILRLSEMYSFDRKQHQHEG